MLLHEVSPLSSFWERGFGAHSSVCPLCQNVLLSCPLLILTPSCPVKPVLHCGTPGAVLGLWGWVFLPGVCVGFGLTGSVCFPASPSLSSPLLSPSQTRSPSLILGSRLGFPCPSAFTCCRCRGCFRGCWGQPCPVLGHNLGWWELLCEWEPHPIFTPGENKAEAVWVS